MKLKPNRKLSSLGGLGVDIKLHDMHTNDQVYWSPRCNSYVVVESEGKLKVLSINGIGEIRWPVWMDCFPNEEDTAAFNYFIEKEGGD